MDNYVIAIVAAALAAAVTIWWFMSSQKSTAAITTRTAPLKLAPQLVGPATTLPVPETDDTSKVPLNIFFASQTGTAENFAKGLVAEGKKRGFRCVLIPAALSATDHSSFMQAQVNRPAKQGARHACRGWPLRLSHRHVR